jgi:biopolymer transport protein TolR
MGMKVGGGGSVKAEPNVVPMIDIMLVLLIIFMIVTPIISAGFSAKMPQGKNIETREEEDGDVVLGIDSDGNYYLDPGTGTITPIRATPDSTPADRLSAALNRVYTNRTKDAILYFRADNKLEYGHVEDAMDIARKAGVRVLAAVTEESRDSNRGGDH